VSHPRPAFRGLVQSGSHEVARCGPTAEGQPVPDDESTPSGLSENALDRTNRNPINRSDLGSRHAVFRPDADARKLRARDLGRHPLLGDGRRFTLLAADRRRRQRAQNTRFPRRWFGRRHGIRNGLFGDLPFRSKERLGRLTRARHPLAIIAANGVLLFLAVEQESPRTDPPLAISKWTSLILASSAAHADAGSTSIVAVWRLWKISMGNSLNRAAPTGG
jgi:hypothetical protein